MGTKRVKQPQPRPPRWRRTVLGAFGLIAVGAAGFWWFSQAPDTLSGTPRLVVDRAEVDLGYLPFEAPARAVFALTNLGDGPLRLVGIPPVRVLKGC